MGAHQLRARANISMTLPETPMTPPQIPLTLPILDGASGGMEAKWNPWAMLAKGPDEFVLEYWRA